MSDEGAVVRINRATLADRIHRTGGQGPEDQSHSVDRIFAAPLPRQAHAYASANLGETPTLENLSAVCVRSSRKHA
jgi:hypothetical protein